MVRGVDGDRGGMDGKRGRWMVREGVYGERRRGGC